MLLHSDGPVLQPSNGPVLQLHITAQFYLESKGKKSGGEHADTKDAKGGEAPGPILAPLLICFFSPHPGHALYKLGEPGVLFVSSEVFTLVLRPSFLLFS